MSPKRDLRPLLAEARLYLLFVPQACAGRDPLAVLDAVLPYVDLVQVRPKAPDWELERARSAGELVQTSARELYDWCIRALELARVHDVPVIANDRPDVARSLLERGLAGVHLGQDDCPLDIARDLLGPEALIGLSTHTAAQVLAAQDLGADYIGFGPIHATPTKGYERGLGSEAAWIAARASAVPVFPIGGIDLQNAGELAPIGRAAVSSAVLSASDPAAAARGLRELLGAT